MNKTYTDRTGRRYIAEKKQKECRGCAFFPGDLVGCLEAPRCEGMIWVVSLDTDQRPVDTATEN